MASDDEDAAIELPEDFPATPADHWKRATSIMAACEDMPNGMHVQVEVARAQVHATMALAGAVLLANSKGSEAWKSLREAMQ